MSKDSDSKDHGSEWGDGAPARKAESFEAIINSFSDMVTIIDPNGTIVYVSPAVRNILGYDPEDLRGEDGFQYQPQETAETVEDAIQYVIEHPDESRTVQTRFRSADESWVWIESTIQNRLDDELIEGLLVNSRDISERKEREEQLETYRLLFENTNDCIVQIEGMDGNSMVRDVNEAFEAKFGYDREDLVGESIDDFIVPDGFEDEAQRLNQRVVEEDYLEAEVTRIADDGLRDFLLRSACYEGNAGFILYMDITKRKEREQQLKWQKEKYQNLFQESRDALMLLDREGFYDCNEETLVLFGLASVEEFSNYTSWELSPETQPDGTNSKQAAQTHVERAFEEGEAYFEWTHKRSNGTEFPAEVKLSRFQVEDEPALLALVRDITERKEYERELEEQRDNLELLNQVFRHDIRNNLQVIRGRADLLKEHVNKSGEEHLDPVQKSTENAIELTKTARNLAETMLSTEADLEPVRLDENFSPVIENAREEFDDAVITTDDQIPNDMVPGNELLDAVFRNLVQNAVVHNDKETPEIQLSATVDDETLTVAVSDNGPGVPDDQKEEIFGKGEKGLDSPGTGIGLYLVRTLVDRYGGDVWVEDNDPEGSVFMIELPKVDVEDG